MAEFENYLELRLNALADSPVGDGIEYKIEDEVIIPANNVFITVPLIEDQLWKNNSSTVTFDVTTHSVVVNKSGLYSIYWSLSTDGSTQSLDIEFDYGSNYMDGPVGDIVSQFNKQLTGGSFSGYAVIGLQVGTTFQMKVVPGGSDLIIDGADLQVIRMG